METISSKQNWTHVPPKWPQSMPYLYLGEQWRGGVYGASLLTVLLNIKLHSLPARTIYVHNMYVHACACILSVLLEQTICCGSCMHAITIESVIDCEIVPHLCSLMCVHDHILVFLLTSSSNTAEMAYLHHALVSSITPLRGLYLRNFWLTMWRSYDSTVSSRVFIYRVNVKPDNTSECIDSLFLSNTLCGRKIVHRTC